MGFVLLGIATLTPVGVNAALFGNVAHGLITGLLFFLAGAIKERYGTTDLDALGGGMLGTSPRLASILTFAAVASLGLPGLAGFWGEMLALLGAYRPARRPAARDVRHVHGVAALGARAHRRLLPAACSPRSPTGRRTAPPRRRAGRRASGGRGVRSRSTGRLGAADRAHAAGRPLAEDRSWT